MGSKLSVGIIPDGNRTWAKKAGLEPQQGYEHGTRVAIEIIKTALQLGTVDRLVFYTLSHENIERRPTNQVDAILTALEGVLRKARSLPNISIQFIGEQSIPKLERLSEEFSTTGNGMQVNFLAVYSAAWDLQTRPIRSVAIPPLDVVIRTSGETRLSGFLPWQSAYSQLLFTRRCFRISRTLSSPNF